MLRFERAPFGLLRSFEPDWMMTEDSALACGVTATRERCCRRSGVNVSVAVAEAASELAADVADGAHVTSSAGKVPQRYVWIRRFGNRSPQARSHLRRGRSGVGSGLMLRLLLEERLDRDEIGLRFEEWLCR
jgi:hypothetical protein